MSFSSDNPTGHQAGHGPDPDPHHGNDPGAETGAGSGPRSDPMAAGRYGGAMGALAGAGWQVLLAAGVAAIALGVFVLAWPNATLHVVGVLFGIYLLVSGVFQLAGAFGSHVPGHLRALGFVSGALCVLLGLICFRGAAESILLLALWIGFGWLVRGALLTAAALSTEGLPARGWQAFLGVVTFLAGVVLIVSPLASLATLTVLAGVWLLVLGVTETAHAVRLRARQRPAVRGHHHGVSTA